MKNERTPFTSYEMEISLISSRLFPVNKWEGGARCNFFIIQNFDIEFNLLLPPPDFKNFPKIIPLFSYHNQHFTPEKFMLINILQKILKFPTACNF